MKQTCKSLNDERSKQHQISIHKWKTKSCFLWLVRCAVVKTQTHNGGPVSPDRALKNTSYYNIWRGSTTTGCRERKAKNEHASNKEKILLIPYSSLTPLNDYAHTHITPVTHALTKLTQPGVSGMQP